jgi:hypothetical protein
MSSKPYGEDDHMHDFRLANHIVFNVKRRNAHSRPASLMSTRLFLGGCLNNHHGQLGFQRVSCLKRFCHTGATSAISSHCCIRSQSTGWTKMARLNHQSTRGNLCYLRFVHHSKVRLLD